MIHQRFLDLPGTFVQNLPGGDAVATRLARVRHLEQPDKELRHPLRGDRFPGRPVSLGCDLPRLHSFSNGKAHDQYQRAGRDRNADSVSSNELADPVARARSSGHHRLMVEMALNIRDQLVGRPVPT